MVGLSFLSSGYRRRGWPLFLLCLFIAVSAGSASAARREEGALAKVLDEAVLRGMEVWEIPGVAYAVVSGDEVIHRGCFGYRKKGETGASWLVDGETVFQIGSTTKAFTAALMAMLVEEGHLSWDDRVEDHLPGFRLKDPCARKDFRVFDLMAQHSGLPDHSLDGMPLLGYGREAVMEALRFVAPETPFRSSFAYQNSLFLYAASIIEQETGRSWEENLQKRLFGPLGMNSAGATFEGFSADSAQTAWLHRLREDGTEVIPMDWPWQDWVYTMGPAGSIHADIDDFARWLIFLIGRGSFGDLQLLGEEQAAFLMEPRTFMGFNGGEAAAYCQGWVRESYRGSELVWHNGTTLGAHSIIALLPEEQSGIVVLTNQAGNALPEALMRIFADDSFGKPVKDWIGVLSAGEEEEAVSLPGTRGPAREPGAYEGFYESSVYGRVEVVAEDGRLSLSFRTPRPQTLQLKPWKGDTFTADWDVFPDPQIFVRFEAGEGGEVDSLMVEPLDDGHGLGRYERSGK